MNQQADQERGVSDHAAAFARAGFGRMLLYILIGAGFGIVISKGEVISWFRIQEMFRFQSFHMYGIIGSALLTAAVSLRLMRHFGARTLDGQPITVPPKELGRGIRYWAGGTIFGVGWALVGACPGPLFALIGNGVTVMTVALASAIVGAWLYGNLRPTLPH